MQTQTIHYIPPVTQTSNALRVAAYARVSSDSSDQLESYAAQVQHYEQLIANHRGWELVDIYADEGLTGTRADIREEFQRLLKDCRKGRIDKVLTKSISRFARNTRDTLTSIRELKALGVEVFFEKERIDTGSVTSEMLISFYGAAAQEESLSISGNMRRSYQWRMKRGEFLTCSAPYGYILVGSSHLIINEAEAVVVRRIFDEFLAGIGMSEIAGCLSDESVPKDGGHWTQRSIHVILKNEKYAGNTIVQKTYTTNLFPFQRVCNNGERTMYHIVNSHPAIISKETYDRVLDLMRRRRINTPRGQYPFSLKIYCGNCGASFKRRITNEKAYWGCRAHDKNKDHCPIERIPECILEQAFIRLHHKLRVYGHEILAPMLEQLTTLSQRAAIHHERVAEIDNEILNIGRQSMLLHRLYGAGHMDAVHYYGQAQGLNNNVNILRRERRQIIENESCDESLEQTAALIDILRDSPERLDSFGPELFKSIVSRVIIPEQHQAKFVLINGLEVMEQL